MLTWKSLIRSFFQAHYPVFRQGHALSQGVKESNNLARRGVFVPWHSKFGKDLEKKEEIMRLFAVKNVRRHSHASQTCQNSNTARQRGQELVTTAKNPENCENSPIPDVENSQQGIHRQASNLKTSPGVFFVLSGDLNLMVKGSWSSCQQNLDTRNLK